MGQLRALQEDLKKLLFVGGHRHSSRFWDGEPPSRLQVYRNTVHGNAYDTLDADYPLTKKQFSDDDWFDLSEQYFSKNAPNYWELNQCVLDFPKFLKAKKAPAAIIDLAIYEVTDLKTFIHTADVKKGSGQTNPTAAIQLFQHQIFDWVYDKCRKEKPPKQKPEVLIFHRDTNHNCHVRRADPLELLMLDHYKMPNADLHELEHVRAKILPQNDVPLEIVLNELIKAELIL